MKHLKKAFCLLLAAVMLLALGVPVMAAGEIPVDAEHFPDAALRTYVTDYCDTNKDNKLSAAECAAVQCIDLFEMQITKVADMTGIEHFTNLRELLACNNQITTLDLSGMTKLEKLDVSGCDKLQSLKLAGCTALTAIDYSGTEAEWAQLTKGENALPEGVTVNFNAPIHHYGSWTGTDPNCTTEGKRTRTCTDDGCGHTEEMTLPARGHYWGIGRVTTLPTETTTGVRTYTCRTYGCNATRTEEIPKLAPRVPVSERFDDVAPNSWAYEDIQYCVDYELMAGVGGGRFEPKTLTTRAQLVQILYRLAGAPEVSGETPFTDLTADWYKTAVLWAYQTGVTSGVSETTFAPDTPVTREQVAVFLAGFADRVLDRYTPYMWDALFPFQDREQISYYARTAMNWACDLGLIKGIPGPGGLRLEPQSSATREQMAVMIARFCRRLNVWNEPMPEL